VSGQDVVILREVQQRVHHPALVHQERKASPLVSLGVGQEIEHLHDIVEIGLGLEHRVGFGRLPVGQVQIPDRLVLVDTPDIVIREYLAILFHAVGIESFHSRPDAFVELLPPLAQKSPIDRPESGDA
jgi:hypothetical protein